MALITKTKTYANNDPIIYSDLNANWDALYNLVNGNLDNSNISPSAAIDSTKISGGAVTLTTAQTIAGQKTLIKPILNSIQNITTDVWAASMSLDMSQSNVHVITLGGNTTLAVTNVSVGQYFSIEAIEDATGGRAITWWPGITWANGIVPTLTPTANKKDTFVFRCTGANTYNGYIVGQNIG